jgi:hypothetical protein
MIQKGKTMSKWVILFALLLSTILPIRAQAVKSLNSDGEIDNKSGVTNPDLVYRDFEITPDGFLTGYIVNESDHAVKSIKMEMWTTNKAETQILWRKPLNIDAIPPKGKYLVKEPYSPLPDDPTHVNFKFRVLSSTH